MHSLAIFLLAFCTAALPLRAQNQSPYGPQDDAPAPSGQPAPAQGGDAVPPAEPENPAQNAPAQTQGAPAPPAGRVPATLSLPSGAIISVRTTQWLSSDRNHPGDTFSAVLDQPVVANGWVVARRGQTVLGRVDVAQKASQGNGASELGLEITDLTLVDGRQIPVSTQMQRAASASPYSQRDPGRSAGTIATTTILGTIVGAAVGRGVGAAIGAGAGAMAGAAVVLSTHGRATDLAPETPLSFQLQSPVNISTANSSVAFRPVTQNDYRTQDAYGTPHPRTRPGWGPYAPGPYYFGAYPCGFGWGCYPGPYVGIGWGWGGWGWGGGYYRRFRR